MIPYIVIILIIFFGGCLIPNLVFNTNGNSVHNKKNIKIFLLISTVVLILITALRSSSVGADTPNYISQFIRSRDGIYSKLDDQFEYGYRIYVFLVSRVISSPQLFLAITALLTNIPIAVFIYKYSRDPFLSIILYITIGSFTFQLTGIRQSIALCLLLLSVDCALKRKILKFTILIALATFFHRSALFFIFVYFLASPKISSNKFLIVVIGAFIIILAKYLFDLIATRIGYGEYINNNPAESGSGWSYIAIMIISIILYCLSFKKNNLLFNEIKTEDFFFAMLVFALAFYLMRYQFRVAERISLYYRTAIIIVLPNSINMIKNSSIKNVARLSCVVLSIALFFYWLSVPNSTYIYSFFWR